ncbi:extracellular solute-binding protein [Zavarzinia sp. CC-PAN008]|uniref:extracellular solute-binding protein n=1 Tax=Zavarzinia sp. CC-PAN008 TaxID=3243332 RepID=UPI003F749E83
MTTRAGATALAARALSRRTLLAAGLASAALAGAPRPLRAANPAPATSSGDLHWLTWEDFAPADLVERFTDETGIRLKVTTYASNEEALSRLRAAAPGFDLVNPTVTWVGRHLDGHTLQPLDLARLKNAGNMLPAFADRVDAMGCTRDGKLFALPWDWVSEALAFNPAAVPLTYGAASYGDLWNPRYAGRVTIRPRSALLGLGLWLEARGDIPTGTMRQAYVEQEAFTLGYGKAADYMIAHKTQIRQFWTGTADHQAAFLQNGVVLGQTWDSPIFGMQKEGNSVALLAPTEGALAWVDAVAIPKGARNLDQAYALIDWMLKPENAGLMVDLTGYNSVVAGAAAHASPAYAAFHAAAFPADATARLWIQGEEKPWFVTARQEMADKVQAA